METLIEQGAFGIFIGILTAFISYFLKVFWDAKFKPFLVKIKYQGVEIDGHWHGSSKDIDPKTGVEASSNDCSLYLIQNAHKIKGSFLFKFTSKEKNFTLDFEVKGYIWEGYITLNFTPKDKRITSYATSLLKLHSGGQMLIGTWLFRDVEKELVNQSPMSLGRSNK